MATTDSAAPDAPNAALKDPNGTGLEPAAAGASARELLVRKLIDIVVLPAGKISANERSLTADILLQVLDKVEESLRVEISRRIARVPEAPPALLRALLNDEPEVASPIFAHAHSLPEALLIEAARKGSTAHREVLAKRLDLTSSVADTMLEFNEPEVAYHLLRREEFAFSPTAIDLLVSRSTADKTLQALLLRRRELEPAHGFMMFWWVDSERRRRILTRFSLDRSVIQDALHDLYPRTFRSDSPDPFVKEILIMLDRRHRPRGVNGEAVSMDVVKRTLAVCRDHPAQEIIHAIGMIAGISRELAARILRDPGGEAFAIMCKSLGIPRDEYFQIVTDNKSPDADEDNRRADYLLGVFDSMARDFSRAVLRYWDWDGNPRIVGITRLLGLDADE